MSQRPPKGYLLALMETVLRNNYGYELKPNDTRRISLVMEPSEAVLTVETIDTKSGVYGQQTRSWTTRLP